MFKVQRLLFRKREYTKNYRKAMIGQNCVLWKACLVRRLEALLKEMTSKVRRVSRNWTVWEYGRKNRCLVARGKLS